MQQMNQLCSVISHNINYIFCLWHMHNMGVPSRGGQCKLLCEVQREQCPTLFARFVVRSNVN